MFNIPFYFRRAFSPGEKKTEKRVRKKQKITPTLSSFVDTAARGVSSSTAGNYRTAVRSFVRFNSGRDVPLSALDAETLRRYERWLGE
ncbi:phage integrase SAM-like domain-containing protein, partial [Bacteroides sp. KG68]|uniref:phage integrase SAM-like domain-containing protein n=1 Tax=unclassified Bacteroides TaxID=2646097 RepID=UPI003D9677B1